MPFQPSADDLQALASRQAAAAWRLAWALPVLLAALAALPLWWTAPGVRWLSLALLALIPALALGWLAWRWRAAAAAPQPASDGAAADAPGAAAAQPLDGLLAAVVPVWRQQVAQARRQTEVAVEQLADSFGGVLDQFDQAGIGAGADRAKAESSISLLTLCERELQPVVVSLTGVIEGKENLMRHVQSLAEQMQELSAMSEEVRHIAFQTNLLALNAAIEAARAGAAGRGFAVVAAEVRALSKRSADTGRRMSERVRQAGQIMQSTLAVAQEAGAQDRDAVRLSGELVEDVLRHVRKLGAAADSMQSHGQVVRAEVEKLLMALQFQDRVSQILGGVDHNMALMQQHLQDGPAGQRWPTPRAWLDAFNGRTVMDEQVVQ